MHSFVIVVVSLFASTIADKQLAFVHLIYRHGARSPSNIYPLDLYGPDIWTQGWKQLTQVGMRQQYELGQYLRERYINQMQFMSSSYKRNEIYVRSTNVDRALQSAYANLAGLFPPDQKQTWNNNIPWQPIPVHCDEKKSIDLLLKPTSVDCPLYDSLDYQSKALLTQQNNNDDLKKFYTMVANNSGLTNVDIRKVAKNLYASLSCEKAEGLSLPSWVNEPWNSTHNVYDVIVALKTAYRLDDFNTKTKAKLLAGYLTGDIVKRMQDFNKHSKDLDASKMIMYSTHDGTVSSLMYALGIDNNMLVPFAACVFVELYQDTVTREYEVQILYRNDTSMPPYEMHVPGCDSSPCSLQQFSLALQSIIFNTKDEARVACASDELFRNSGTTKLQTHNHSMYILMLVKLLYFLR